MRIIKKEMFKGGETAGVMAAKDKKADTTPDWAKGPEPSAPSASAAAPASKPSPQSVPDWAKDGANTEPIDLTHHEPDATQDEAPAAGTAVPDWATKKAAPPPKAQPAATVRNESAGLIPKKAAPPQKKGKKSGDDQYSEPLMGAEATAPAAPGPIEGRPRNFPPFPERCKFPCKPCMHINMQGEIPEYGYSSVRILWGLWWATAVAFVWNLVALLVRFGCGGKGNGCSRPDLWPDMVVGIIFVVCGIPCGVCCWFQIAYNAFRLDSPMRFSCFFFTFMIHIVMVVLMATAFIPATGASGYVNAFSALAAAKKEGKAGNSTATGTKIVGYVILSSAVLWTIIGLVSIYALQKVLMAFRGSGHTLRTVKAEGSKMAGQAAVAGLKTEAGQKAIVGAASSAWDSKA